MQPVLGRVAFRSPRSLLLLVQRMLTYWNPSITELPPDGGRAFDSLERVDVSTEEGRARLAELQRCEVPFKVSRAGLRDRRAVELRR